MLCGRKDIVFLIIERGGEGGRIRKAGRKEGRKGRERHSTKRSYILMF